MLIDNIVVNKIWGNHKLQESQNEDDEDDFVLLNAPSNPDAHSEKARAIIMNNIKRNSSAIKVIRD